jgi:hypothetical protein
MATRQLEQIDLAALLTDEDGKEYTTANWEDFEI